MPSNIVVPELKKVLPKSKRGNSCKLVENPGQIGHGVEPYSADLCFVALLKFRLYLEFFAMNDNFQQV